MPGEHGQTIYFIGVALPEPLNTQISRLQWQLYDEANPKMLKPLLPHVTLLHPPALRGTLPEELIPKVHAAAENYLPLAIELRSVHFFSDRVCSLSVQSPQLHALYQTLIPALPLAVQAEQLRRDFSPHVTLAQVKTPEVLDRTAAIRTVWASLDLPLRFTVTSLSCFKRIVARVYKPATI